jgi:hypothetical protein
VWVGRRLIDCADACRAVVGAFHGRGGDTTKVIERVDDELDDYLGAYYGQTLDVMRHVQAIRGGSVAECLDWLARYVEAARYT